MADLATKPVETLRAHATALEAALSVCLGDPKPKAVHKLRTETRRIEAQLLLLKYLNGLPPFRKQAIRVRKHLKKLRRAAGQVRDLDVQRKLLQGEQTIRDSRHDARTMAKLRQQRRDEAASVLLQQLHKRQAKLATALEALLFALEPVSQLEVPTPELLTMIAKQFSNSRQLQLKKPTTDQLHTLRKAAKVARYLAESAPDSTRAKQAAARYQSLQQAGGEWHDWMQLQREARDELGRHNALVTDFSRKSTHQLTRFRKLLQPFRST